jgi:hypothetical protein
MCIVYSSKSADPWKSLQKIKRGKDKKKQKQNRAFLIGSRICRMPYFCKFKWKRERKRGGRG